MSNSLVSNNEKKWPYVIAVSFVLAWTIWHSFLGVDLVDTGYYYYQYLHPTADNISYSTYLATLIGAVWIRLFPNLGLWGLNVLELLLEYILCLIVYLSFRKTFRKKSITIALVFCMLAISTYVNVFNYHQLSMFLYTSMLCFMYTGLRTEKMLWQVLAGAASFLSILSRFPCVLTLLCITCIIYWRIFVKKSIRKAVGEIALFVVGFSVTGAAVAVTLKVLGVWDKIINDVFRMSNLSGSGVVSYGVNNQFKNLLNDTIHGVEAVFFFLLCAAIISYGLYFYFRNVRSGKSPLFIALAYAICTSILLGAGFFGSYIATYKVGRAPNYIQLTSFSWFMYGVIFVSAVTYTVIGMIKSIKIRRQDNSEPTKDIQKDYQKEAHYGAIAFMGLAMVLLSFVGSAARSKHAILGMWFIAPLMIDKLFDVAETINNIPPKKNWVRSWIKTSIGTVFIVFFIAFSWFVMNTNNFDEPNLSLLTAEINNEKVKYLKTTKREADEVDAIVSVISEYTTKEDYLMVIGNPVMLYALTDRRAYVRPWVTGSSYLLEELKNDFLTAEEAGYSLPMIIEAKTNPYLGFSEDIYESQLKAVASSYANSEKVKYVREFMEKAGYKMVYESDYFKAYLPDVIGEGQPE